MAYLARGERGVSGGQKGDDDDDHDDDGGGGGGGGGDDDDGMNTVYACPHKTIHIAINGDYGIE